MRSQAGEESQIQTHLPLQSTLVVLQFPKQLQGQQRDTADEHSHVCFAVGLHNIRRLFITVTLLLIRVRQPSIVIDSIIKP
jgi:hypothetical protein